MAVRDAVAMTAEPLPAGAIMVLTREPCAVCDQRYAVDCQVLRATEPDSDGRYFAQLHSHTCPVAA